MVRTAFVPRFRIVTVAPGTGAPLESVIVPVMVPEVLPCAFTRTGKEATSNDNKKYRNAFLYRLILHLRMNKALSSRQ
jgi:hypothetical protein